MKYVEREGNNDKKAIKDKKKAVCKCSMLDKK
jgi:hypothetical protein